MTRTPLDLTDKIVLVTGGTGTVGSAIVHRLLATDARGIRVYSRDESKQFELRQRLPPDRRLRYLIGDTRDRPRLERAMEQVSVVFHAAAMKHVLSCEYNPFEAVQTNVVGTQNLVDAALDAGVERVMFASTDKAVSPTSTMGVSKLLAEKLLTAADAFKGPHATIFTSVRFGNIVGSRGSVVPLFVEQIAHGGPLTLTDRRMSRFMMTVEQAVDLMLMALGLAKGGEVFALKMPALRIEDLADLLRDRLAPSFGRTAEEIAVDQVGAHPGEKLYEDLLTEEERERALETDELFIVLPQIRALHERAYVYDGARAITSATRSDQVPPLGRDDLQTFLVECGVLEAA